MFAKSEICKGFFMVGIDSTSSKTSKALKIQRFDNFTRDFLKPLLNFVEITPIFFPMKVVEHLNYVDYIGKQYRSHGRALNIVAESMLTIISM